MLADIGELDHVKEIIRWGSDYLLKVFDPPNSTAVPITLYSQACHSKTLYDDPCSFSNIKIIMTIEKYFCSDSRLVVIKQMDIMI